MDTIGATMITVLILAVPIAAVIRLIGVLISVQTRLSIAPAFGCSFDLVCCGYRNYRAANLVPNIEVNVL